jgi:hypothetical protein
MEDEEPYFRPRSPPYPPPNYIATTPPDSPPEYNETHPFLPEIEYQDPNNISTYVFICFIQDYTTFLREYLVHLEDENYITTDDYGYYNSFIDICNEINTDEGDDDTFETYRATLEPLMEWMTEECGQMNVYHEQDMRNALAYVNRQQPAEQGAPEAAPTGVANRTRSKQPATGFEIPPNKRSTNIITLEPTKQEGVRIKLSDGKEYTYDEIKDMWRFSNTQTPLRHIYTEEDKQKINDLIDLATKGGKKTRKNKKKVKKTRKARKNKSKKVRKPNNTRKNK